MAAEIIRKSGCSGIGRPRFDGTTVVAVGDPPSSAHNLPACTVANRTTRPPRSGHGDRDVL
jgi:hypothetical protein